MQGICRGMNQGEVQDVIFLWYFLSNKSFRIIFPANSGEQEIIYTIYAIVGVMIT